MDVQRTPSHQDVFKNDSRANRRISGTCARCRFMAVLAGRVGAVGRDGIRSKLYHSHLLFSVLPLTDDLPRNRWSSPLKESTALVGSGKLFSDRFEGH